MPEVQIIDHSGQIPDGLYIWTKTDVEEHWYKGFRAGFIATLILIVIALAVSFGYLFWSTDSSAAVGDPVDHHPGFRDEIRTIRLS